MAKCTATNCDIEAFQGYEKCVLHCEKHDYQTDRHEIGFLESFYTQLIEYIITSINQNRRDNIFPQEVDLRVVLNQTSINQDQIQRVIMYLSNKVVKLDNFIFPDRDSRDYYDYQKALDRIGSIHFDTCEFYCSSLDLDKCKVFFQDCTFQERWYLYNHNILENIRSVLYQMCIFKQDVSTVVEDYKSPELNSAIFSDCVFEKSIILENVNLKARLFNNSEYKVLSIDSVKIFNTTFQDKFILNNYSINHFICESCEFNNKMEFKLNTVNVFTIDNTNYHKLVDCYKSSFDKFIIKKSIFDEFVGFEDCNFGLTKKTEINNAEFRYATFLTFINFRNARFNDGLDLQHINIKEPPNFLNVYVSSQSTNRETFRIIKYSFDKIGNYIEANRYYELEMLKYKEELRLTKNYSSRILLQLYQVSSRYGQSFVRPIVLIIITSVIYWLLEIGYEQNTLYLISPSINSFLKQISDVLNGISKSIIPFNRVLKVGMESVTLLFYILFSSLIWLSILAIKRKTKR